MSIYDGGNIAVRQLFEVVEDNSNTFTKLQAELAAADGDVDKARKAWLDSTDHEEVVKLRAAIAKAQERLTALSTENVSASTLSEKEREAKTNQLKELRTQIRKGRELVLDLAKQFNDDVAGVEAALTAFPDVTRGKSTTGGHGGGSSLPRVSVDIVVNGGRFTDAPFATFTALAQALKVDVAELQKAFADAAGVAHAEITTVKRPVTFSFGDYKIRTTPKATGKPGPKAAA